MIESKTALVVLAISRPQRTGSVARVTASRVSGRSAPGLLAGHHRESAPAPGSRTRPRPSPGSPHDLDLNDSCQRKCRTCSTTGVCLGTAHVAPALGTPGAALAAVAPQTPADRQQAGRWNQCDPQEVQAGLEEPGGHGVILQRCDGERARRHERRSILRSVKKGVTTNRGSDPILFGTRFACLRFAPY